MSNINFKIINYLIIFNYLKIKIILTIYSKFKLKFFNKKINIDFIFIHKIKIK